jgi:Tol biopolymer transport system component/DNA-binding winged helix-turn-helix (wHTH) protein
MSLAIKQAYRFGEFIVDDEQKVLLRNGSPLPLAPKVFDTLLILVNNCGRIVEKEELMNRLWPNTFVEESNLTFNIQQLRKALGDDARRPQFIETVARRGYRFIAEVNENSLPIAAETEVLRTEPGPWLPASKRSYLRVAVLSVLVIGSAVIAARLTRKRSDVAALSAPILAAPFRSENFANASKMTTVITPNGKYVAYTNEAGGKQSLWLRQLETSENIQIVPPTEGAYLGLAVSHDGNSLYFARSDDTARTSSAIYRVMTFGGIPIKITESNRGWIGIAPDDRHIAFVRCRQYDEDFCSLFISDADGKNERVLVTRPKPFRIVDPEFSADGKSIIFATGQSRNGGSNFRMMGYDLTNGKQSEISSKAFFEIESLQWLPNGDALLFTGRETLDGPSRIWQVMTATGQVKALTGDANNYSIISLDKAAASMTATYITNTFQLYLAPISDLNNVKLITGARTFTFSQGGQIIYASNDGDIWTINREGGEHRQLTNSPYKDYFPRVSPDGRYIFFASARSGSNQVWRMNADGSNQIQLSAREGGEPRFVTPDQSWLYFESTLTRSLWRVSPDGKDETQVSHEKVFRMAFSPDGRFVAYFYRPKENEDHFKIGVMSLEDGKVVKTFALPDDDSPPICIAWEANNESFDYVAFNGKSLLWRQPLKKAEPILVADLGTEEINDFAVSPDGKSIGFIRGRWIHGAVLIHGLK